MLESIYRWLYRGTRGRLVFDHKPYCYYDVVASKRIVITLYDHMDGNRLYSGTFTATFTCYEPFGHMFQTSYSGEADEHTLAHTGLLPASMMPASPMLETRSFIIYNPGTEAAHTIIRIAGDVGSGMLIRNLTTSQRCRIIGLRSDSLLEGQVLSLDSYRGQTRTELGEHIEMAFPFHDEGYITLAPCTPFVRNLRVNYTANSNIITSDGGFLPYMMGQFIYLNGWKCIRLVSSPNRAVISEAMTESGTTEAPVVTMNEIEISGDGLNLTRLEIDYTPRVR